jgi:hypothetical protein
MSTATARRHRQRRPRRPAPSLPVRVQGNRLSLANGLSVSFERTLRLPDDGRTYGLPPSLGRFPLHRVEDYAGRVPDEWLAHGGVFMPMFQREAMWIRFDAAAPHAVKIATGKVCAISGRPWSARLHDLPQDYVVTPAQPWVDGINSGHGSIRQFVAAPLGSGYTIEGQITGEETVGGLQIAAFAALPGRVPERRLVPPEPTIWPQQDQAWFGHLNQSWASNVAQTLMNASPPSGPQAHNVALRGVTSSSVGPSGSKRLHRASASGRPVSEMGLAAGGSMRQSIHPDPHGLAVWDQATCARVFVHIVNSVDYRRITGKTPAPSPVGRHTYSQYGYPWQTAWDEWQGDLAPSPSLAAVESVGQIDAKAQGYPWSGSDVAPGSW